MMANIAAGIVLYNPDLDRLQQNIAHVLDQVGKVILVDNGSRNIIDVAQLYENSADIVLIRNSENTGVAAALNQIVHYCEDQEYGWVLTLDQDSVCSENLVEHFLPYISIENVAILTPCIIDINEDKNKVINLDKPIEYVERCITSASLTNVHVCSLLGYFDPKMFIDYVDFDYCIRAVHAGYKIVKVNSAIMYHELGRAKRIDIFLHAGNLLHIKKLQKYFYTYNHSPLRTYYYARNSIYYIRKHKGYIDLNKERRIFFRWMSLKLIFEKNKFKKFSAILKGINDGRHMKIQ